MTSGTVQVYRGEAGFRPQPLDAVLAGLEQARLPFAPAFESDRIALIGRFAASIQKDPRWRDVAPVQALAFWLRKAAVTRMAEAFRASAHPQSIATGRGIAFHLPPQNVDTLFLYSWAIAFACGNTNIVRLPEQVSPTMTALLEPLIGLLDEAGSGDLFLTYPRADATANELLSAVADCRLVWGGDAKAEVFNRLPMRLGGKSLAFSDRYSHAILSAPAVAALDEDGLNRLAKGLHDDIRLFDQQACSSPHTIHLVDVDEVGLGAVRHLLERLDGLARRAPTTDPAHGMAKFAAACALAADDLAATATRLSNETTVIELVPTESRGSAVGGGFLSVRIAPSLAAIAETLTAHDQTLSHFGLSGDDFAAFAAQAASRGVARLVPVGNALNFDQLWDGYDLVGELTRVVRAKP
jgi:hypothetical protein